MLRNFSVLPDTLNKRVLFFKNAEMDKLPNIQIVPLFGANGAGKTTVLHGINDSLEFMTKAKAIEEKEKQAASDDDFEEIEYLKRINKKHKHEHILHLDIDDCPTAWYSYQNSVDNFRNRTARSMFEDFDPTFIKRRMDANALSEGQSIMYSVRDLLEGMLPSTKARESFADDKTHSIVLLDEIDSGLSLDNLDQCLRIMKRAVRLRDNVQFIFSFNTSFVLTYFPDVLSMYDGKVIHLETEADMLDELNRNKQMLKKARQKSNGQYRIF